MSAKRSLRPPGVTTWERFARVAADRPDQVALVDADPAKPRSWSYRQLAAAARAAAGELITRGVQPGDIIAVIADRQCETVALYLAINMAGAAYLPVDPDYPAARTGRILRDARPKLVLTTRDLELEFDGAQESLTPRWFEASEANPMLTSGDPNSPAYVMYTSGSTGEPKGVVVPHRGIIRLVCGAEYFRFGADRVFLQMAPLSFDASTLEIWGPLLNGGRCVLFPQTGVPDLELFREVLRRNEVNTLWLTTSLFNGLVSTDATALRGIETLFVGGEALSVPHIRSAQAALPGTSFVNGYGPTENTTFTTCFAIPNPVPEDWSSIPIGSAITGTTAYVLDATGNPVPHGEPGELYTGGFGVALGYLNRPDLTAQRFLPDPFAAEPGALMYRTGDQVRQLDGGVLSFEGRNDTQVKVRGNRVELGEIENLLLSEPRLSDARVRLKTDRNGEKHLVAYYVTDGDALEGLDRVLAQHLPAAIIPRRFVRLTRIPVNANGKLDEASLPNPFNDAATPGPALEADGDSLLDAKITWSTLPELVEGVWRLVLPPGTSFNRRDSFFEVGGTSLGALQVSAKLSRELGRSVPIVSLFEFPTIDRLAGFLQGATVEKASLATKDRAALAREARQRRRGSR